MKKPGLYVLFIALLCTCTSSKTGSFTLPKTPVVLNSTGVSNDSSLKTSPKVITKPVFLMPVTSKNFVTKDDIIKALVSVENINLKINDIGDIVPQMYERLKEQRIENDSLMHRQKQLEDQMLRMKISQDLMTDMVIREGERNETEVRQNQAFRKMVYLTSTFIFLTFCGICGIYLVAWTVKTIKEREVKKLLKNA